MDTRMFILLSKMREKCKLQYIYTLFYRVPRVHFRRFPPKRKKKKVFGIRKKICMDTRTRTDRCNTHTHTFKNIFVEKKEKKIYVKYVQCIRVQYRDARDIFIVVYIKCLDTPEKLFAVSFSL